MENSWQFCNIGRVDNKLDDICAGRLHSCNNLAHFFFWRGRSVFIARYNNSVLSMMLIHLVFFHKLNSGLKRTRNFIITSNSSKNYEQIHKRIAGLIRLIHSNKIMIMMSLVRIYFQLVVCSSSTKSIAQEAFNAALYLDIKFDIIGS